jgi:monoterpene epsilon-lactone hydrolase
MVSKEMKKLINKLKQNFGEDLKPTVQGYRIFFKQLGNMTKIPKDAKCEPLNAAGIPAEWISVPESKSSKIVLYFHGGGYIAGSIDSHRDLCIRIARASKTRVLLIDYRLAPEHLFPAALEDAIKVYQWLISSKGINSKKIIIAGESAGGGLTIATLIKLKNENINLPKAAICLSPFMDLAVTGDSVKTKAEIDPMVTKEDLEFCAKQYLGDQDRKNPFASPLYADLQDLPPLLIQVGSSEVLLDDSLRFVDRAKNAGAEVSLEVWDEMIHMFQLYAYVVPEGQEAINKIGEFIQKSLN